MVISVSTLLLRLSIACSAARRRCAPSKVNGRVTTPMVSAPISRATEATIVEAPEPVPPPMPGGDKDHVGAAQDLVDLLAALFGRPLADVRVAARPQALGDLLADPQPLGGVRQHQCLRVGVDGDELYPLDPSSIMRLTAFWPPPPTPTTLMWAKLSTKECALRLLFVLRVMSGSFDAMCSDGDGQM